MKIKDLLYRGALFNASGVSIKGYFAVQKLIAAC